MTANVKRQPMISKVMDTKCLNCSLILNIDPQVSVFTSPDRWWHLGCEVTWEVTSHWPARIPAVHVLVSKQTSSLNSLYWLFFCAEKANPPQKNSSSSHKWHHHWSWCQSQISNMLKNLGENVFIKRCQQQLNEQTRCRPGQPRLMYWAESMLCDVNKLPTSSERDRWKLSQVNRRHVGTAADRCSVTGEMRLSGKRKLLYSHAAC